MADGCIGSEKNYEKSWEREECGPEETLCIEQMESLETVIGQNMSNVSLPLLLPCHL